MLFKFMKKILTFLILFICTVSYAADYHVIGEGNVDVAPLITSTVGLSGVAQAFEDLGDPERHAKILVDPTMPA